MLQLTRPLVTPFQSNMPVNRMRMRPWLVQMIESSAISGLDWVDKEKTIFTIPWKHAARHGWDLEKDACLFQKWAVHTGKHTEGQAKDPKTWKANFRCALNSLPDIEEVKDRSVNKGHHAKRVFKMLPQASKSRDKRAKGKATKTHRRKSSSSRPSSSSSKTDEDIDSSETRSSADESALEEEVATQENTVGSSTPDSSSSSSWSPCSSSSSSPPPEDAMTLAQQDFSEHNWPIPDTLFHRFQVSPDHHTDYDATNDIIEICRELERMENIPEFRGSWTNSSPVGSQLSDSSVDESDDARLYTTLGSDSVFSSDWSLFRNFT